MTRSPTSPQRLLEGGTDYERQLLAASNGYVPSTAAALRVAAALRATRAGARGAPPSAPLTSAGRLLKPALGVVAGGILAALVASQWPRQRGTPDAPELMPVAAPVPQLLAPSTPPAAVQDPQVLDTQQPDTQPLETQRVTPRADPVSNVVRRPPPVKKPAASRAQHGVTDLAAELRAIESLRTLLGWGQTQQAEAALRDYRARFPQGELALEADLTSVELALAQGDLDRARSRARELLERPGASRYRARLSSLLDTNSPAPGSKPRTR